MRMVVLLAAAGLAVAGIAGAGCSSDSPAASPSTTAASAATAASSSLPATAAQDAPNPQRLTYGDDPSQFGELWLPADATGPVPVVVLIHGGFWREQYGLDLMTPLAEDLVGRGFAAWNVEYRRVGQQGGGYPGTLEDVAAAIDLLASPPGTAVSVDGFHLDLADVVFVGHSAGGHLALWAAGRSTLPAGAPGAGPVVTPRLAIGQGPVFDLTLGDERGLGGGAVTDFMGSTAVASPERYAIATPSVSSGVPLAVIRGGDDDIVPAEFTVPTPLGGVQVVDVPGEDHFAHIDPTSGCWAAVIALLTAPR